MYKIVLIRHGESTWNKKGLFTGWVDVALTALGREEAKEAGKILKKNGFVFDLAFTSFLKRASVTLKLALQELKQEKVPIKVDWRLNERHYGNLQGLNKLTTVKKFGAKQVLLWRRGYNFRPPEITKQNSCYQILKERYKNIEVPKTESLKDVVGRVVLFWQQEIIPALKQDERIIIVASGNSLRALIKYLDKISASEVVELNIPYAIPLVYELDKNFNPQKHYYLGDIKKLQMEVNKIKNQIKPKK